MSNNSNSTAEHTFTYIEHMLIEMRTMSEKENAPVLAYLIEMAIIEARDMVTNSQNHSGVETNQTSAAEQQLVS